MRELVIGKRKINDDSSPFVVLKLGANHNGDLQTAIKMIDMAKSVSADSVLVTKRDVESGMTKELYEMPYDHEDSYGKTFGEHKKNLEFNTKEYESLVQHAKSNNIKILCAPLDIESVRFLERYEVDGFVVESESVLDIPLVDYLTEMKKPLLISTEGCALKDIETIRENLIKKNMEFCILQGTKANPVLNISDFNLAVISRFRQIFQDNVIGFSDHQNGIDMAPIAYMLGARVFVKQFTLNRAGKGEEHAYSLGKDGIRRYVRNLKRIKESMGDAEKKILSCEKRVVKKENKIIVAAKDLEEGQEINVEHIAFMYGCKGLEISKRNMVIGKKVKTNLQKGNAFETELLS